MIRLLFLAASLLLALSVQGCSLWEFGREGYHSDPSDGGGGGPRLPSHPPKCSSKSGCGM